MLCGLVVLVRLRHAGLARLDSLGGGVVYVIVVLVGGYHVWRVFSSGVVLLVSILDVFVELLAFSI